MADDARREEPEATFRVPPPAGPGDATVPAGTARRGSPSEPTIAAAGGAASVAPKRLGKFEILQELGAGGMGAVYRARQADLDRVVALKVLHGAAFASAALVERFLREARAAARLDHPGIVRVFEVGEQDGVRWFAMELVEGEDLLTRVRQADPPLSERVRWVRDAALAISYAHGHGLVHRDLKPANLLVDARGTVKVADFGLARDAAAGGSLTLSGEVMGTPQYMAPEQARGRWDLVGPRSDVYSLGATLYELVCGRPVAEAPDLPGLLQKVAAGDLVPLRLRAPHVSRDLETIVSKCLEAEPSCRYASARELADDLDRFLRFEAIHARPATLLERAGRLVRRHVGRVALALGAVVLLGGGVWVWEARRAAGIERDRLEALRLYEQAVDARHVLAHGGIVEQERLLRDALARSSAIAEPCLRLGLLCEWTGRTGEAFGWYREAHRRVPSLAEPRAREAILDLIVAEGPGDPRRQEAAALVEALAGEHRDDPYAQLAMRFLDATNGSADTSTLVALDGMGTRVPDARLLIAGLRGFPYHPVRTPAFPGVEGLRDLGAAFEQVEKAVAADPLHLQARVALGLLRLRLRDLGGAGADFRAVGAFAPEWDEARYDLGLVLLAEGRLADAVAELEAAAHAAPGARNGNHLAVVLALAGRFQEALAALDRSLKADPRRDETLALRAMCLIGLGRREEAEAESRRYVESGSTYVEILQDADRDLAKPQVRFAIEAIRQSLLEFQDVLFLAPRTKRMVKTAIPMVLKVNDVRDMMKRYDAANEANPALADLLGYVPRYEKDVPELGVFLEFLRVQLRLKVDPHVGVMLWEFWNKLTHDEELTRLTRLLTPDDYLWRAGIRYRSGDLDGARADLEEAGRLRGTDARVHYGLATVWALGGEARRCADALRTARQYGWREFSWIAEDPDFERVRDAPEVQAAMR